MHTQVVHNRKLRRFVSIRVLDNGDTATVAAVFDRLGPVSREHRFHGAKPRLTSNELALLSQVDGNHHVLVAHVDGDPLPAAMARIVRDQNDRRAGELAFEVADAYQGCGIGVQLVERLLADARAAGIVQVEAFVQTSNSAALTLLRRVLHAPMVRVDGSETLVAATV
jgi:GNAT superfamily N-acetyltransferase